MMLTRIRCCIYLWNYYLIFYGIYIELSFNLVYTEVSFFLKKKMLKERPFVHAKSVNKYLTLFFRKTSKKRRFKIELFKS